MGFLKKLLSIGNKARYHQQYESEDIVKLFEDLEETYYKKLRTSDYFKSLERKEEDAKAYENLEKEDLEKLVALASQYKTLQDKQQVLKGRLIKNNQALYRLSQYEDELPELMKEIQLVEKKVKDSERDIFYLSEEKEELIEEREILIKGYQFLKGFSIFFVIMVAMAMFISFSFIQTLRETIWVYLSLFGCVLVIFLAGIIFSKEKIEKGLRRNELLQQKAVRYLNKAKIRYFHNYRYMQFEFEKLGVDSSAKLEMYYNRYVKNKHNESDYNRLTKQMVHIETIINGIFKTRGVQIESMETLEEWMSVPKKAQMMKQITEEKQKIKEQITALEAYEEEIWKEIFAFKSDERYTDFVEEKIKKYSESVGSLDRETAYT
jgi:hypothetical protein